MPCYDPGDGPGPLEKSAYIPGSATMRKYVATLKDIEDLCQASLADHPLALGILDIIDEHWSQP